MVSLWNVLTIEHNPNFYPSLFCVPLLYFLRTWWVSACPLLWGWYIVYFLCMITCLLLVNPFITLLRKCFPWSLTNSNGHSKWVITCWYRIWPLLLLCAPLRLGFRPLFATTSSYNDVSHCESWYLCLMGNPHFKNGCRGMMSCNGILSQTSSTTILWYTSHYITISYTSYAMVDHQSLAYHNIFFSLLYHLMSYRYALMTSIIIFLLSCLGTHLWRTWSLPLLYSYLATMTKSKILSARCLLLSFLFGHSSIHTQSDLHLT